MSSGVLCAVFISFLTGMYVCVADDVNLPAALMMNHAYHRVADAIWDMVSVEIQ